MTEEIEAVNSRLSRDSLEDLKFDPMSRDIEATQVGTTYVGQFETVILKVRLEKSEVGHSVVWRVSFATNSVFGMTESGHTDDDLDP